jgi:hypothetical protein
MSVVDVGVYIQAVVGGECLFVSSSSYELWGINDLIYYENKSNFLSLVSCHHFVVDVYMSQSVLKRFFYIHGCSCIDYRWESPFFSLLVIRSQVPTSKQIEIAWLPES